MKLSTMPLRALPAVAAGLCLATTAAQAVGVGWLWSRGMLTRDKAVRYAAVLYGLDLSQIPRQDTDGTPSHLHPDLRTPDEVLAERLQQNELLNDRYKAVARGTDAIRLHFETARSDNERFDQLKDRFDAHLAELESEAKEAAIREVQRTLEVLRPRQSKDLILRMLDDQGRDEKDDVLAGVVTIVKTMPQDRRKKILGEFKTEEERERLHEILLAIGELDSSETMRR